MNDIVTALCKKITPEQFEAMLLLYEAEQGRIIIGCDIDDSKKYKCYKFIEKDTNENYLLVIWFDQGMPDFPEILKLYPEYNSFTFCDYTDDLEKPYYLRWLCKQPVIPDFLKELCDEVKKSLELLN